MKGITVAGKSGPCARPQAATVPPYFVEAQIFACSIEALRSFVSKYSRSTLKDDALFELANTLVSAGQEQQGLQTYDRMINEFKGSSLVPQAMMRQGLVHYNASRNEQALSKFKTVVHNFPNTQEAIQAVSTAKLIYVDMGRVDEYAEWVKGVDFVEVTDTELDNATFESADKQNMEGKKDAAMRGYEKYVQQFPNGLNSVKANFNLAQLYFAKGDKESLKNLLTERMQANFSSAIEDRNSKKIKSELTFIGIKSSAIQKFEKTAEALFFTVKFVSEIISVKKDKNNKIVEGDPNKIKTVIDHWKFTRKISSPSPNWYLAEIKNS